MEHNCAIILRRLLSLESRLRGHQNLSNFWSNDGGITRFIRQCPKDVSGFEKIYFREVKQR